MATTYYIRQPWNEFIPFSGEYGNGQYLGSTLFSAAVNRGMKYTRAAISVFNSEGSNVVVDIEKVRVIPVSTGGASVFLDYLSLKRFDTSVTVTGGEDLAVAKLDTALNNVPSGFIIRKNVAVLAASNQQLLGMTSPIITTLSLITTSSLLQRNFGEKGIDPTALLTSGRSPTQGTVLRPGEGLFLEEGSSSSLFNSILVNVECVFTINGGTSAYFSTADLQIGQLYEFSGPNGLIPKWVIYNGTVSDYITIRSIKIRETGSRDIVSFSLERIESTDSDGTALNIIKLDTSSADVPAGVLFEKGSRVKLYKGEARSLLLPVYRRGQYPVFGDNPGKARFPRHADNELFYTGRIRLRQGDGVAFVQRSPSSLGNFNVEMQFTVDSDPAPGGGGSGTKSSFIKTTSRQGFK